MIVVRVKRRRLTVSRKQEVNSDLPCQSDILLTFQTPQRPPSVNMELLNDISLLPPLYYSNRLTVFQPWMKGNMSEVCSQLVSVAPEWSIKLLCSCQEKIQVFFRSYLQFGHWCEHKWWYRLMQCAVLFGSFQALSIQSIFPFQSALRIHKQREGTLRCSSSEYSQG